MQAKVNKGGSNKIVKDLIKLNFDYPSCLMGILSFLLIKTNCMLMILICYHPLVQ